MTHDETVERVARAILPVVMAQVTGRAPRETYDTTIEENREAARELSRAALSALPPRDELLREALEALQPFAAEYEYWVTDIPEQLMLSDGNGTLSPADIKWDAIVRARAAADKIRAALEQQQKETP